MKTVGGILAGGRGRRMEGIDKPFAELAGRPLIAHVIERLARQTDGVILNANSAPERFDAFGLDVVADSIEGFCGPLAGVHALMQAARNHGASHVLVVPADTPFLPRDLLPRLVAADRDETIVRIACSNKRQHPVVALWPVTLADHLGAYLAATADLSMAAYLRQIGIAEADFSDPDAPDPFFNINDPADLARAEQIISSSGGER
ncbi:MAG: molybdenum cofactor guanylyltransferase MobA [Hoeflea sp.]|uniref:molybdenum cofactor guanylyltransferase MobA n=1 Tax=Hoeflea sp. TaxID=1940281 RepID=UPI001D9ED5B1|nr:molybdenum cofactor guanylyltransferase MobA [Hoeflea sp.]MBU4530548.1 molybdenum cofactor guanylyltransferase MobA [Alphaproteobacteria bacterium]MBU4545335.1 molybdenum cofactor guanylyltransferase MobA [Alphaproteobacteria bacterium]MBU4548984.1 molybdenum cofactor guanylyltransferase MobA [Alphaproteobacteria bacterium]MBV1722139.1 molybdenum cofactor guanylyltransferase MobA [Hoeflea sp.]MBV1761489.1 molybdenum cofactor guanylyltransferase MobA [Hoeflea sp.]